MLFIKQIYLDLKMKCSDANPIFTNNTNNQKLKFISDKTNVFLKLTLKLPTS